MDFIFFIDTYGEPATAALIGLALGIAFGALVQRSGFCTRSALLDVTRLRDGRALALWLTGFAIAIFGTQLLFTTGQIALAETRFFATPQSLSGAIIGGLVFGAGMVLTRGCTSRLLVLGSAGNLRAVFSIAIIAAVAWATIQGPLTGLRDTVGGLLSSSAIGTNDLGFVSPFGTNTGLVIGTALLVLAIIAIWKSRLSPVRIAQGVAIGGLIPAGWWLTYQLSQQVFEPIQAESLSFMRPLATTINFGASGGAEEFLNLDTGLIAGTVVGALLAAIVFRSFRIQTFSEPGTPHVLRYVIGAVLMGFGGILAVGCTIGAGFTGGSALAITSLVGLAAMFAGGALTDVLVDRVGKQSGSFDARSVPAE